MLMKGIVDYVIEQRQNISQREWTSSAATENKFEIILPWHANTPFKTCVS